MALTEEQIEALRAIGDEWMSQEGRADLEDFLSTLPKPKPVGVVKETVGGKYVAGNWSYLPIGSLLYAEAPVTKPVSVGRPDIVPPAWMNLLEYVLQDDLHNRLTPRVVDIAYTAFMLAKESNKEDGGNSDWFNDTKPSVMSAIKKLRKDLIEYAAPQTDYKAPQDATQALNDVIAERHRQQSVEGWTPEHDDQHKNGELALAAAAYAFNSVRSHQLPRNWWPWAPEWWKPTTARRDLVKAAALILARIEQIDRSEIASVKGGE